MKTLTLVAAAAAFAAGSAAAQMHSHGHSAAAPAAVSQAAAQPLAEGDVRKIDEMEAETIRFAIAHYRGQMSEVARKLGIGRSTLYRKMKDLGLGDAEDAAA